MCLQVMRLPEKDTYIGPHKVDRQLEVPIVPKGRIGYPIRGPSLAQKLWGKVSLRDFESKSFSSHPQVYDKTYMYLLPFDKKHNLLIRSVSPSKEQ